MKHEKFIKYGREDRSLLEMERLLKAEEQQSLYVT